MSVGGNLTNGGNEGATGGSALSRFWRDARFMAAATFIVFGLIYMVVNAASLIDQRRALDRPIPAWQAWVLEGSSFAAWLVLLPLILFIASRLSKHQLWLAVAGHVAACVLLSLAHSAIMIAIRAAVFPWSGSEYEPIDPIGDQLFFEFRKDVITYVSIVAVFLIARHIAGRNDAMAADRVTADYLIEVRDGSRVIMLRPEEIDWIGSAGNYVELHGAFGSEMARRTLADLAEELEPSGFVRVHRSRVVRRAAIAAISTRQSGDFDIRLRSGDAIVGSRRFRGNLL